MADIATLALQCPGLTEAAIPWPLRREVTLDTRWAAVRLPRLRWALRAERLVVAAAVAEAEARVRNALLNRIILHGNQIV